MQTKLRPWLPWLAALAVLSACQAAPVLAPQAATPRVVANLGQGGASITVKPPQRALLAGGTPQAFSEVVHVTVALLSVVGTLETPVSSADLSLSELGDPFTFAGLHVNTTYRLKATAYSALGTDPTDRISTTDYRSQTDIVITNDDQPATVFLPLKLLDDAQVYVLTDAGLAGAAAYADDSLGDGGATARFDAPQGVAVDAAGVQYVADTQNNDMRRVDTNGNTTTLAGSGIQAAGFADNTDGTQARFKLPEGVALDAQGVLYVADTGNNCIRKVLPNGSTSTLAGSGTLAAGFADNADGRLARFGAPGGLAVDALGNVYVADTGNHCIRKLAPNGATITLAGTNIAGYADNTDGTQARFSGPSSVAVDAQGNVYVADTGNSCVRKIAPNGATTTLSGSRTQALGGADDATNDQGALATFGSPTGIAVDAAGVVYVSDTANHNIRRIEPHGQTSTLAGSTTQTAGFADDLTSDAGAAALFSAPFGLAAGATGSVFVADTGNSCIRRIP